MFTRSHLDLSNARLDALANALPPNRNRVNLARITDDNGTQYPLLIQQPRQQLRNVGGKLLPETFVGNSRDVLDIVEWIQQYEECSEINGWDEPNMLKYIGVCLTGGAKLFHSQLPEDKRNSWANLKQSLLTQYTDNEMVSSLRLKTCIQEIGESIRNYGERLTYNITRVNRNMEEKEKVSAFLLGLLPEIQGRALPMKFESLADAIQTCEVFELANEFQLRRTNVNRNSINSITELENAVSNLNIQQQQQQPLNDMVLAIQQLTNEVRQQQNQQGRTRENNNQNSRYQHREDRDEGKSRDGWRNNHYNNREQRDRNERRGNGKFCLFCRRYGHDENECRYRKQWEEKNNTNNSSANTNNSSTNSNNSNGGTTSTTNNSRNNYTPPTTNNLNTNNRNATTTATNRTGSSISTINMISVNRINDDNNNESSIDNIVINSSSPLTTKGSINDIKLNEIILDTGAGVCAINAKVFKQLPPEQQQQLDEATINLKLTSASASKLNIIGRLPLDIILHDADDDNHKVRLHNIQCMVIENLAPDCIIGNNQLEHLFEEISVKRREAIYIDSKTGEEKKLSLVRRNINTPDTNVYPILLVKATKVLPNSEVVMNIGMLREEEKENLKGQVKDLKKESFCCLIESEEQQDNKHIKVKESIMEIDYVLQNNNFPIRITNEDVVKHKLKKGEHVASIRIIPSSSCIEISGSNIDKIISNHSNEQSINNVATTSNDDENSETKKENKKPISNMESIGTFTYPLNQTEEKQFQKLLEKYQDVFATNPKKPTVTNLITHKIDTGEHPPIKLPAYRIPYAHDQYVKKEIESLLENGAIEESTSPWSFPIVLVNKKDGSIRLCIDFRKLNKITKQDSHPIPNINDLLDSVNGAVIFSSVDLASGYWQIKMDEASKEKTAFVTKYGLYQWKVMPFGLSTAPATFVKLIDLVLNELRYKSVIMYIDDLVIFSRSVEEHLIHLEQVFERLKKANLQLKQTKCRFAQKEIQFLGYSISAAGIKPDEEKLKMIQQLPGPKDITALRSFLGLTNFYRRFIRNYSNITLPLLTLTKKDTKWTWNEKCEEAFQRLKGELIKAPILASPDFSLPFTVYTDASKYAIGGILGQVIEGKERVIHYASRVLQPPEINYSTTEKEALAILWCVTKMWRNYLLGVEFIVVTDHQPLTALSKIKDLHGRLGRWSLALQPFNFTIKYREGEKNHVDFLSRLHPINNTPQPTTTSDSVNLINTRSRQYQATEEIEVKHDEEEMKESDEDDTEHEEEEEPLSQLTADENQQPAVSFSVGEKVLVKGLSHPGPYTITYIEEDRYEVELDEEPRMTYYVGIEQIVKYMDPLKRLEEGKEDSSYELTGIERLNREQRADSTLAPIIESLEKETENCKNAHIRKQYALDNNHTLVYIDPSNNKLKPLKRIVIPTSMKKEILETFHDSPLAGHLGITKTYQKISSRYYWLNMAIQIENWIKSCEQCSRKKLAKSVQHPIRSILPNSDPLFSAPFSEVVVDTLGPLTTTKRKNSYIVIFIDRLTRFPEAFPVKNQKSTTIARLLVNEIIPRYGAPRTLLSDQGSNYLSKLCRDVYNWMSISKLQTSAYYPQCNGLVERFNHTIINMIAMFTNERQDDWDEGINQVLFAYRSAINQSTGFSPFFMLHGYSPRYPADLLVTTEEHYGNYSQYLHHVIENIKTAHEIAKENLQKIDQRLANSNINLKKLPEYDVGDKVLLFNPAGEEGKSSKLLFKWKGPWKVIKRLSPVNYRIKLLNNTDERKKILLTTHVYRMRRYVERDLELQ